MTSSFPSRTVIGATTFLCYIMLAIESPAEESQISWGPRRLSHWALVVALILTVSWSRIFTGNHYPSCCISGFIIGLAVHFTGVLLARNHIRQCACEEPGSCSKKKMTSVATLWVCLSVPLGVFIVTSLGSEPFAVWRRSYQALSLLIPTLVFIYGFLCPSLSGNIIEVTENHSPSKQTLLTALILTSIVSAAAAAPSSTHAIASSNVVNAAWFLMILVLALLSLITSRLVQQHENASVNNNWAKFIRISKSVMRPQNEKFTSYVIIYLSYENEILKVATYQSNHLLLIMMQKLFLIRLTVTRMGYGDSNTDWLCAFITQIAIFQMVPYPSPSNFSCEGDWSWVAGALNRALF